MKKVFIYEIKRLLIPMIFYMAIMAIIEFTVILSSYSIKIKTLSLWYCSFLMILVLGIIVISFSYNKKRISADMTYALPATKNELFQGKYLASITAMFGTAIAYLLINLILFGFANLAGKIEIDYTIEHELRYFMATVGIYGLSLLPLYHFFLLFYYKANSILDGLVFSGFGMGIYFLIAYFLCEMSKIYAPQFLLSVFANAPFCLFEERVLTFNVYYIISLILGYLILIYLLWFARRDCSIRTQDLSNGIFGYKVFIPILGILTPIATHSNNDLSLNIIGFILITIGLFLVYCIYHRSIKFNKTSYISFGILVAYNLIYSFILL